MPTSIVNQTIELPVARDGSFDQFRNLFDLGNVAANEVGLARSSFIHFSGERCARAFASRAKHYLRPCIDESAYATFAYATAASGDDYHFVGVVHFAQAERRHKKARGEYPNVSPPPARACLITSGRLTSRNIQKLT